MSGRGESRFTYIPTPFQATSIVSKNLYKKEGKRMGKYDTILIKSHKSISVHNCYQCGKKIYIGELVYYQSDKFLQNLSRKRFCEDCFNKYGQKLIEMVKNRKNLGQTTLN